MQQCSSFMFTFRTMMELCAAAFTCCLLVNTACNGLFLVPERSKGLLTFLIQVIHRLYFFLSPPAANYSRTDKTNVSFTVEINASFELLAHRSVLQLSCCIINRAPSVFHHRCSRGSKGREKKKLLNIRNAGTHLASLSTPNLPALIDVAISQKNTIIAHDPGHPLHCHFTKVPSGD